MMKDTKINYYPFFYIHSDALKEMLGVKDIRSVKARINEMGVTIHFKGKNGYVITEEVLQALKGEKPTTGYISKNPKNNFFY